MRIGMLLLAAGAAAQEPVARLLPELNATMKARAAAVQAKRLDAASSTSTIEQCFVNVCSSDAVRSDLVSYCKAGGYDSCDSLSFHNAYYNAGTYAIRSEFAYDLDNLQVTYSKANAFSTKWDNQLDAAQSETFAHEITKSTTQSWSSTTTAKVSSSLSVSTTAGLPEVCQEKISVTVTAELDVAQTEAGSATTSQSWSESQTINIPAKTCALGCMTETDGDVELPYTVSGTIVPLYAFGSSTVSTQCCYLRPGGSNECGDLGGGSGGWSEYMTPNNVVSWANAHGISGCEGFGTSVNDATWSSAGIFKGGMGMNVSIATVECDTSCSA